jgi:hypothetical protein
LIQYEPPSIHIHAAQHTHDATPQKHVLQQHDDITTQESISNITWQVQHAYSNYPTTTCYKKIYDEVNIYAVT